MQTMRVIVPDRHVTFPKSCIGTEAFAGHHHLASITANPKRSFSEANGGSLHSRLYVTARPFGIRPIAIATVAARTRQSGIFNLKRVALSRAGLYR